MNRNFDVPSLSAFMDGELDAISMQEVDAFLTRDAEAQRFVLDAVRGTSFLKAAANAAIHEQVPERLRRALGPAAPSPAWARRHPRVWQAAAAVLLAAFGFWAVMLGGVRIMGDDAPVPVAALVDRYHELLDATLENNLSGTPREWHHPGEGATVTVTPVRTYRDSGRRYYREYRLQVSSGAELREVGGLAYRTEEGRWKTTALFF